ncbi:MAG: hypothetical protein SVR81_11345 [Chloroflexota bacterium]|nr:hypothetical protein [Chloroflexota bacterium]
MKRKWLLIVFLLGAFVLTSCNLPGVSSPAESDPMDTAEPEETMAVEERTPTEATEASDSNMSMDTDSVCYHPLFPVADKGTWTYQYDDGDTYTMTVDATGQDTFTLTQEFDEEDVSDDDELVLTMDFYCTSEGLLQGDFAQIDLFGESGEDVPEINFDTVEWTGETLPAMDLMEIGYTWTATYTMEGEFNIEGMESTAKAVVTIDYILADIEEVTVPAGAFPQAYRIESSSEIAMSMGMDESIVPFSSYDSNSTIWYVEGVGMVKTQDEFSGISSQVELIDSSLIN